MRERQFLYQLNAFGFSAVQISTELENIEATKNFTFRKRDISRKRLLEDFDQFEISVPGHILTHNTMPVPIPILMSCS